MLSLHLSCSDHHVQEGWRVAAPYAIGVSTANKAYLLAPTALAGANLSEYSAAPAAARLVDDIWMNGHLAARGVRRYVVPLAGFSPDSEGMGVGGRPVRACSASHWRRQESGVLVLEGRHCVCMCRCGLRGGATHARRL